MPAGYRIGDHHLFVVDFLTLSLVGTLPPKIVRTAARRLNTRIPSTERKYVSKIESLLVDHNILERTGKIYTGTDNKLELKRKLDFIDVENKDFMLSAEKKCWRINLGRIPFSPESSKWIRRAQVYRSILRFHAGKIRNRNNLKRAARRCGIEKPLSMPISEIKARLKVCKEKCNFFCKHRQKYRTRHLKRRLEVAKEKGDEEAEVRILAIIKGEKDRAYWRKLNFGMAKPQG